MNLLFMLPVPNAMFAGLDVFSVPKPHLCYSLTCVWCELSSKNEGLLSSTKGITEIPDDPNQGTTSPAPGKEDVLSWSGHGVFEGLQSPRLSVASELPVC